MAQEDTSVAADTSGDHSLMTEQEVAALSDGHTHCLVCYSDLNVRGKTPCCHDDVCGVCHLRLRFLHSDNKCPICKAANDKIIVDVDPQKGFDSYPMWGDEIGAGFVYRDDVGMFFENNYFQSHILPLFGHACNKCDFRSENDSGAGKKHTPLKLLQEHLRTKHRLSLCQLCIDHKRDFVSQLPRMTPSQLHTHLRNGDGPTSGFFGHPVCEFCKPKRFYDLAFLHQHLHKEHYKCHVCEKNGVDNQFLKNYKSLERHFDQQHFLCHDVQCLAARFVVFENELDLRGHELSVHGGTSTGSTKINLEFRTRRAGYDGSGVDTQEAPSESDFNYGLDGQAFVPQALPNSNDTARGGSAVQLHPLHIQRTEEFRAQAAAMREQHAVESQTESFPSLQTSAANSSSAPLVGWASGTALSRVHIGRKQAGKVTEEDFPTLSSGPSANANAKKKAIKGNIGATRKQFAVMSTSASQSQQSWGSVAAPSAPGHSGHSNFLSPPPALGSVNRQANLAPDNFPSLGTSSSSARAPYAAANAYAKKQIQRSAAPSMNSASDFPSMAVTRRKNVKPAPPAAPPPLNSTADFPAPPSASSNHHDSVRGRVLGDTKQPSQNAMSNMLQASLASTAAKTTVEDMKAALGPGRFKQLKRLTKDFAGSSLSPEGYVDQSAALFDKGYGDSDFWSFLPSLIESCPNRDGAEVAINYMTSLKRQQHTIVRGTPSLAAAPTPPPSSWGGNTRNAIKARPTTTSRSSLTQPVVGRPHVVPSKKKQAWGNTGAASVVRAKAPPGSVAAAASNQGPQGGSATKFMAKQQKKENKAKANPPKAKGQKKKKKDELRSLAFGK